MKADGVVPARGPVQQRPRRSGTGPPIQERGTRCEGGPEPRQLEPDSALVGRGWWVASRGV